MNERGIEFKVGVLVTVCLGLLVVFIFALGDFSMTEGSTVFVDYPTSADLKSGAPVKVAGVAAGKVQNVDYVGGSWDEDVKRRVYVRIELEIDQDKFDTIRQDAAYYITTLGILGEKYVEIDPGTHEAEAIEPNGIYEGMPPLRMEVMAANISRLVATLSKVVKRNEGHLDTIFKDASDTVKVVKSAMQRVDKVLVDNQNKVGEVFDEILTIEGKANKLLDSVNTAVGDGHELRKIVSNVEGLTRDARYYLPPVVSDVKTTLRKYQTLADRGVGAIDALKVEALGVTGDVRKAIARADKIIGNVITVTDRIKNGEGLVGAILSDRELYDDIREMMKDLQRHPWKFLWKE